MNLKSFFFCKGFKPSTILCKRCVSLSIATASTSVVVDSTTGLEPLQYAHVDLSSSTKQEHLGQRHLSILINYLLKFKRRTDLENPFCVSSNYPNNLRNSETIRTSPLPSGIASGSVLQFIIRLISVELATHNLPFLTVMNNDVILKRLNSVRHYLLTILRHVVSPCCCLSATRYHVA